MPAGEELNVSYCLKRQQLEEFSHDQVVNFSCLFITLIIMAILPCSSRNKLSPIIYYTGDITLLLNE